MKTKSIGITLFVFALIVSLNYSCGDYGSYGEDITSPIILSNTQHHVGDNTGAEGMALSADFEMPSNFSYAELQITFDYPNQFNTSGPDVDSPPEIKINGSKIGVWTTDFTAYPNCIDSDREFACTITLAYNITSSARKGSNTFVIRSTGFLDNADDFTFSTVKVIFE
jgi:hypothetical protein